jgi:PAS domain S-box-containing protein
MTLRRQILLTLSPLLLLLAVLGGAGVLLVHHLGGRIDVILRENYESVIAMEQLKESLERIDSSFQFMLVARGLKDHKEREKLEGEARKAFHHNWESYQAALRKEQDNITIHPREDELVERLEALTRHYHSQGNEFYQRALGSGVRHQDYYAESGLYTTFTQIKQVADDILQLNQKEMKLASDEASRTALNSTIWLSVGLVFAGFLAGLSAWHTIRTTLRPIQALTEAALGISSGNLDQVVPLLARDELGQLAQAFNTMARHLRDLRQSHTARLLRAQRTSQATIDSFPDPVVVVDSEGYIEMANPAARNLLGVVPRERAQPGALVWQPAEPLRQPLLEALHNQRDYLPEGFDRAITLGSDGRERSFLPRILAIRDPYGNTLGAAAVLQDVTRFRFLDQFKSDLVATVSHELKTPLTSLRLDLHLVLEESVGPLSPKQTELLLDARDNAERLLAIVNNLLDLARLEEKPQRLDLRPEPPAELVRIAAEEIRPRAEDKGVELVVEVPHDLPLIAADSRALQQALGNLLDNAMAYTDRGGQVTLSALSAGDRVTLTVSDTGVGIPPEYLPRVFERFFRVPGQSRGIGTGLGLAIVREIVVAHGGTITCTSQPGAGTTFRLTLPVWVQKDKEAETGLSFRAASAKR